VAASVRDPANLVYGTWEMAIKAALGRISVDPSDVAHAIGAAGFDELAVTIATRFGYAGFRPIIAIPSTASSSPRRSRKA
jgi:hypothetical protein